MAPLLLELVSVPPARLFGRKVTFNIFHSRAHLLLPRVPDIIRFK